MRRFTAVWLLTIALAGCASRPPVLAPVANVPASVELRDTPFFPQRQYHCGPAALATVLTASGVPSTPDALAPLVYIPERQGSLQLEILAASRRHARIPYVIEPGLGALLEELHAGRPVLVLQNLGLDSYPLWHYAVVVGYAVDRDELVLRSGVTKREVLSARRFVDTWRRAAQWGVVLLRPGELPARAVRDDYLAAVAATEDLIEPGQLLQAYRAALGRWPDSTLAQFGIAASLHRLGDLAAAERAYRHLLTTRPGHVAALNNLAEVLADRGCLDAATGTIERALDSDDGTLREALLATRTGILARTGNAGGEPGVCTVTSTHVQRTGQGR